MKINEPVTQRENPLSSDDTIISTTNRKGVISSINDDFLRISGFEESELVGRQHNVVRHPDMPPEAFSDLWKTIKAGKPWMGLVKNRCKNGDHYFVDAYVTPVYEGEEIVGYQSVRFKPEQEVVDRAMRLYGAIRSKKSGMLDRVNFKHLGYAAKYWIMVLLTTAPVFALAASTGETLAWCLAALTLALSAGLGFLLVNPVLKLASRSRKFFENPLAARVYSGRGDEVGQLELVIKALRSQNRTLLGRVEFASEELGVVADATNEIVEQTTEGVRRQQLEVDQMATAMNEMAATVAEVAKNAEETAASSADVLAETNEGAVLVNNAVADITALSESITQATTVIEKLKEDSQNIGSVVDVISNIASETNLLALNAAIEAARAGEQGRGFAVVADEVRNLASNTQKSTDEIQQMIKTIQQSSAEAVAAMEEGRQRAEQSVDQANRVGSCFGDISASIKDISGLNTQVATAAEEQSAVAEEINRNVVAINDVASQTLENANGTAEASAKLTDLVSRLRSMIRQFGHI